MHSDASIKEIGGTRPQAAMSLRGPALGDVAYGLRAACIQLEPGAPLPQLARCEEFARSKAGAMGPAWQCDVFRLNEPEGFLALLWHEPTITAQAKNSAAAFASYGDLVPRLGLSPEDAAQVSKALWRMSECEHTEAPLRVAAGSVSADFSKIWEAAKKARVPAWREAVALAAQTGMRPLPSPYEGDTMGPPPSAHASSYAQAYVPTSAARLTGPLMGSSRTRSLLSSVESAYPRCIAGEVPAAAMGAPTGH